MYNKGVPHHRTMSDILLEIQDAPGEIYDMDWQSGLRAFRDDTDPALHDAVEWVAETHNMERTDALIDEIYDILKEDYPEEEDPEMIDSWDEV